MAGGCNSWNWMSRTGTPTLKFKRYIPWTDWSRLGRRVQPQVRSSALSHWDTLRDLREEQGELMARYMTCAYWGVGGYGRKDSLSCRTAGWALSHQNSNLLTTVTCGYFNCFIIVWWLELELASSSLASYCWSKVVLNIYHDFVSKVQNSSANAVSFQYMQK